MGSAWELDQRRLTTADETQNKNVKSCSTIVAALAVYSLSTAGDTTSGAAKLMSVCSFTLFTIFKWGLPWYTQVRDKARQAVCSSRRRMVERLDDSFVVSGTSTAC